MTATTKTNKIGSVNPCDIMYLFDENNNEIGKCLDTPNSFSVACLKCSKIAYGITYDMYFGNKQYNATDKDIQSRINSYKKFANTNLKEEIEHLLQFIKINTL